MQKTFLYFILLGFFIIGCSKEKIQMENNENLNELEAGWEVPINQLILSEGPLDPIPSIDSPYFKELNNSNLKPNETVFVYRFGNIVKVYPQSVLQVHEIVNDRIGDHHFAVTLCPRTGSAIAWNREINGKATEFGVSGHLYNENLIPYDRNGQSFWSQMGLEGIKGINTHEELKSSQLVLTLGSTLRQAFPNALVLVDTSGYTRNSVHTSAKQGNVSSVSNEKQGISSDYFGVINRGIAHADEALLFEYGNFTDSIEVHNINFRNSKLIIAGSNALQFIVAFKNNLGDPSIQFNPIQNALPIIFADNKGNSYDITGLVVSGPSTGFRLISPIAYTAHSFAWELFYHDTIEFYVK